MSFVCAVNLGNSHWVGVFADFEFKILVASDSLGSSGAFLAPLVRFFREKAAVLGVLEGDFERFRVISRGLVTGFVGDFERIKPV